MENQKPERPRSGRPRPLRPGQPQTKGIVTDVIVPLAAPTVGAYAAHKLGQRKPKKKR
jgi:hypothetical protein